MKQKTMIQMVAMVAGTFAAAYFGPWWASAVFIIMLAGLMGMSIRQGILSGMLSLTIVYLGMSVWKNMDDPAKIIIKTGALLGGVSPGVLIILTMLIGLVTGLLSGWLGSAMGIYVREQMSIKK